MGKLKVLYDQQVFDMQKYGGISRYFANLAFGINKSVDASCEIACLYSTNYYLQDFPLPFNNQIGRYFLRKDTKRIKWNDRYNIKAIKKSDYDVFHTTYYDPYFLDFLKKPFVLTVHDMIHEKYPAFFRDSTEMIERKSTLIKAAHSIIAISKNTKKDILAFFPEVENKVSVIYHGLPISSKIENCETKSAFFSENYLLYVGERNHYKNFSLLIEAIYPILHENEELYLFCAGGGEFLEEEKELLRKYKIQEKCLQGNVTDKTLGSLYKNALAFVYPSLEEGFGLPMLEAFRNNCPIISSNTSCLPEVGGNAVKYFNPFDKQCIHDMVKDVISSEEIRSNLVEKGVIQLSKFSFERCLSKTLEVYKSLK